MLTKIYRSFMFAWNGLRTAWQEEHNFRIEVLIAVIVVFFAFFYKFSSTEIIYSTLAIMIVLSAEILNTAVEDLCNKVQPEHDSIIGKIKDTMAAFVLISCLGAGIVGFIVFYHHFIV